MDELKKCPFCGCQMTIMSIGRDWYRLIGDHEGTCMLNYQEIDVPQTTEQRLALIIEWNTRTPELPSPCTVEQYEEITAEKFPDDGLVWGDFLGNKYLKPAEWELFKYKILRNIDVFIVQTAQGMSGEGV